MKRLNYSSKGQKKNTPFYFLSGIVSILLLTAFSITANEKKSNDPPLEKKSYRQGAIKTIYIYPNQVEHLNELIKTAPPASKIFFKPGVYKLSDGIDIDDKHNLQLVASGDVYFVLQVLYGPVIWITDSDNISLEGFHAKHRRPRNKGESCVGAVIFIHDSHDIMLKNLELNGSGTEGVLIDSSISVSITDSYIHSNTVAGISIEDFADNIFINNNRFENNPVHFTSNYLRDDEWDRYLKIENNTFDIPPKYQTSQ